MSIAQRSVAGEGEAHPCAAETQTAEGDAQARAEFTCDTTNLPWVIFRAVHRAGQLNGTTARGRALLAALARTVDAKRPYAAIFARRELLTGRAMQSMRTFYRSLDDLEAAGLITRPPQSRYGQAGLFGRAYLHLTESAALLLGLVAQEAPVNQTAPTDAKVEGPTQAQGESLPSPSATVADRAIYKDLFPASQKRQPGTLPADLQRLTSLGFHEFLVFKLMLEAKKNGKLLSDVVAVSWEALRKAYAPINYLRALLAKPTDFAHRRRVQQAAAADQMRNAAEHAKALEIVRSCAGESFYNVDCTRRITVSNDSESATVLLASERDPRTAPANWTLEFVRALLDGKLLVQTDERAGRFQNLRGSSIALRPAPKSLEVKDAPADAPTRGNGSGHLDSIKQLLRKVTAGAATTRRDRHSFMQARS
ncbi:replication protein O [Paraburkholderia dioscoreae]|uniref:Replication protein O n=1 Tax=Paraburkholderia dioscoreae TaxID=2604047 RepID=A0A5Q4ZEE2_9BURK|nr:replication protein O [Paraburkholderia dioscoreae]VVD31053.1 conserved protein of unknown function [Paraburkholderia dioscoreae]